MILSAEIKVYISVRPTVVNKFGLSAVCLPYDLRHRIQSSQVTLIMCGTSISNKGVSSTLCPDYYPLRSVLNVYHYRAEACRVCMMVLTQTNNPVFDTVCAQSQIFLSYIEQLYSCRSTASAENFECGLPLKMPLSIGFPYKLTWPPPHSFF